MGRMLQRLRDASADSAYKLVSWPRIGYERQGCSRAVDVVLHRGRPLTPIAPLNHESPEDKKSIRELADFS